MIILLSILVVFMIAGYYLKSDYSTARTIIINKPKQEVYDYIKFLRNQNNYSYYNIKDPETIKSYSGTDAEIGFTYNFSSKNNTIGTGTQTICKIVDGELIACDIVFSKPLDFKSFAEMRLVAITENETELTWTFSSTYKFPLNIIIYFANLEKLIGDDIASSLKTLKEILDNK